MKLKHGWFDLQRFDDGGDGNGGDGGQGGGTGTDDANTGGQTGGNGGGSGDSGANDKPFATFPTAESFNSRIQRESAKQLEATAKEFGFDTVDAMKTAVKDWQTQQDQQKTELQRQQEENERLKAENQTVQAQAKTTAINAAATTRAATLGIKPERIAYALRLADLSGVEVTDGKPDDAAIKTALEKVVEDLPELKSAGGGSTGSSANPAGGGGADPPKGNMNDVLRRAAGRR